MELSYLGPEAFLHKLRGAGMAQDSRESSNARKEESATLSSKLFQKKLTWLVLIVAALGLTFYGWRLRNQGVLVGSGTSFSWKNKESPSEPQSRLTEARNTTTFSANPPGSSLREAALKGIGRKMKVLLLYTELSRKFHGGLSYREEIMELKSILPQRLLQTCIPSAIERAANSGVPSTQFLVEALKGVPKKQEKKNFSGFISDFFSQFIRITSGDQASLSFIKDLINQQKFEEALRYAQQHWPHNMYLLNLLSDSAKAETAFSEMTRALAFYLEGPDGK